MTAAAAVSPPPEFEVLDLSALSLEDFRPRIARWANAFDHEYRSLLYALGNLIDLKTSTARVSLLRLSERMQEAYERQGSAENAPSVRTIQRRLRSLRVAGLLRVEQPRTADEWRLKPQFKTNRYQPDLTHVIQDKKVVWHDFFAPIETQKAVAHGLTSGEASSVADVPSVVGLSTLSHSARMPDSGDRTRSPGASPRTPEARDEDWFGTFRECLEDLVGRPVGLAGVRKHCAGLTEFDLGQEVVPLLELWVARNRQYVFDADNPVGYVLGAFPTSFSVEREEVGRLFEEVIDRGESAGLLKVFNEGSGGYELLDIAGNSVDEWSEDEFEYLTDDPANLYALLDYFRRAEHLMPVDAAIAKEPLE